MLLAVTFWGVGPGCLRAQSWTDLSVDVGVDWQLVRDGERAEWPGQPPPLPFDSVAAVGRRVLDSLRQEGFYYAQIDSATIDTSAGQSVVRFFARSGPKVRLDRVRIIGGEVFSPSDLRTALTVEVGEPLNTERLEGDIQNLLERYEEAGRPLAQVRVSDTLVTATPNPALRLTLRVKEGPQLWLKRVEVPEDARTSPELLTTLADLEPGEPMPDYDPEALRQSLRDEDLFHSVGSPKLRVTADGGAILRVPVEEAPPGSFDLVVGYLPAARTQGSGQLVGSGHLRLRNVFGGGRRAELKLNRRPGQASLFDVRLEDPYLLGLPVRIAGHFRGEQRDSTYGKRTYQLEGGYRLAEHLEGSVRLSREVVRPGPSGARLQNGRQQAARSRTVFYGVGLRYEHVDDYRNPRRGLVLDLQVDRGYEQRRSRRVTGTGDTTRVQTSVRQEQFRVYTRGYIPLFGRQVIVVGGDGSVLRGPVHDRSDLFRFGGATSLRGYDEDRFMGTVTARGLFEYRLQLDPRSYVYAFADLGYVERPGLGRTTTHRGWHPGYGLGVHLQTAIGRIRTSYALNPEVQSPTHGRVHLGLSVGL